MAEWITCYEAMPGDGEKVLTCGPKGAMNICRCIDGDFIKVNGDLANVVWWMPLPMLPWNEDWEMLNNCNEVSYDKRSIRECPKCRAEGYVIDSRLQEDGTIKRRRECPQCGYRWTTGEVRRIYK